jgi:MoaA/NifB/PqqE/SkfB family radical SAM enzyme
MGAWVALRGWLGGGRAARPFQAFQIEVTTRCALRCAMCPRTALQADWPELDLPWESYVRVAAAFGSVQHVHLQGWGEPLLHPRLCDMIALAKAADCRVGLTTNGSALEPGMAARLVERGLDLIAISIAGATPETHGRIRVGSQLPRLLENVARLAALRAPGGPRRPKIELAYLMTRDNLAELPAAVETAARLGVDEVYATNLDYLPGPEHARLAAFAPGADRPALGAHLTAAAAAAERAGVAFRAYPLDPDEVAICEGNPLRMLFVSADGWVSPCTYLGLAGRSSIPRHFEGESTTVPRARFGNVRDADIPQIWEQPEYAEFRRRFAGRRAGTALSVLVGARERPRRPDPPPACRSCYKLYGL